MEEHTIKTSKCNISVLKLIVFIECSLKILVFSYVQIKNELSDVIYLKNKFNYLVSYILCKIRVTSNI